MSAPSIPCAEAKYIVHLTQHALDDLNEFSPHHLRLRLIQAGIEAEGIGQNHKRKCDLEAIDSNGQDPALRVELQQRKDGSPSPYQSQLSSLKLSIFYTPNDTPALATASSSLATFVAESLRSIFFEEQASIAHKFVANDIVANGAETLLKSASPDLVATIAKRETRSLKYASNYHLTFSLFTPGPAPSNWAIEYAIQNHVKPWVSALASISSFKISSQVQLYSPFSPSVRLVRNDETNGTLIRRDDLSAFINAAEWPLSPSVGPGPTINFVLYVPSADQLPLTVADNAGTSWLIAQWGGVTILNPPLARHPETGVHSIPAYLDKDTLKEPFETFISQLLPLLGVPAPMYQGRTLPLSQRLQAHTRLSTLALYLRASSTLGSLVRLSQSLSSIPIPEKVAKLVVDTMSDLLSSCELLQQGEWSQALAHAREAYESSEKAFFEKSMVGQVYFPDEHKVAVYLPLLGPLGVPLIIGLLREMRRFGTSLRKPR